VSERISIAGKGKELFFGSEEQPQPNSATNPPEMTATHHAIQEAADLAGQLASEPATMPPSAHGAMRAVEPTVDDSELVRRLRDQLDEEHNLHYSYRFAREEIEALRDAVYELEAKRGLRVTRNDVVRLGLEWIIDDYKTHGKESLLVRVMGDGRWRLRR
jgi:hypothetical protein